MSVCCYTVLMYCHMFLLQTEQELELVLSKQNMYSSFVAEWTGKWIPAVIGYCEKLKRKDIKDLLPKGRYFFHITRGCLYLY